MYPENCPGKFGISWGMEGKRKWGNGLEVPLCTGLQQSISWHRTSACVATVWSSHMATVWSSRVVQQYDHPIWQQYDCPETTDFSQSPFLSWYWSAKT